MEPSTTGTVPRRRSSHRNPRSHRTCRPALRSLGRLGSLGSLGSDGSQVTVPPTVTAATDQRLPIFDSLESDWFRRSGTTMTGPQRALGGSAPQPDGPESWTSPADEGWRAAQVVASPAAGETTQAGLPRRVPRANLVPGSVGGGS